MDDNYISEEEYQQKLDDIRERDPNLYEYIMWGNSSDEPFDYDAMEVRLLLAIKEQEEEQKQPVGDLSKMTAISIAERILTQYGMGQEVYTSGKEITDAMRYNPAKITMSGAAAYERKEIAPGKFINVVKEQPFTHAAWYTAEGKVFGDNPVVVEKPISGVDGHLLAEDEASTWVMPGKYEPQEGGIIWADKVTKDEDSPYYGKSPVEAVESAIDWKKLEASREDRTYQEQSEEIARKITTVFGIPLNMLGVAPFRMAEEAEIQQKEIMIELIVGHNEMGEHRDALREAARTYNAKYGYGKAYLEYYDMVYRLCAEGYSLEQALYGYKK